MYHWFLPHKKTHQKAKLISWQGLLIYVLIFILLQVSFSIASFVKPGVLGIDSAINQEQIIELTNRERQDKGLEPLIVNKALAQAAQAKAANMFAENYWAHFAPSGKSPWDFILGAGYKFSFAGENLAKNFYKSDEVVKAWMNSPSHRDNLLSPKYRDIGVAVVDGVLNGQKTTLVVQEFGTTSSLAAKPTVEINGQSISVDREKYNSAPQLIAQLPSTSVTTKPLLDPYQSSKMAGIFLISLMAVLLMIDLGLLVKRGVFRISSHHIAHLAFLTASALSIINSSPGSIL